MSALSRRRLITGTVGLLVAGVLTRALPGSRLLAKPPLAAAVTPSDGFMLLSRALTGMAQPDALLAQRLYSWLHARHSGLDTELNTISALLQSHPAANGLTLLPLLAQQPEALNHLYQSLVAGWYLGVVGPVTRPQCIAFENIVSYRLVKDSLLPPSYAPGEPNFWTRPPVRSAHV